MQACRRDTLIAPHFHSNKGIAHGFLKMVTTACDLRLASLPPQPYPFPQPTPFTPPPIAPHEAEPTVIELSVATATITIPAAEAKPC